MSDTVIKFENLSKQYRLGLVGTGTLSHDLNRWWCRMRGKPDPYAKVTEANDRTQKGSSEYVWTLKRQEVRGERHSHPDSRTPLPGSELPAPR